MTWYRKNRKTQVNTKRAASVFLEWKPKKKKKIRLVQISSKCRWDSKKKKSKYIKLTNYSFKVQFPFKITNKQRRRETLPPQQNPPRQNVWGHQRNEGTTDLFCVMLYKSRFGLIKACKRWVSLKRTCKRDREGNATQNSKGKDGHEGSLKEGSLRKGRDADARSPAHAAGGGEGRVWLVRFSPHKGSDGDASLSFNRFFPLQRKVHLKSNLPRIIRVQ